MKNTCGVSWETLLDYQEGTLSPPEHKALKQHLATGCAACEEAQSWLKATLPALAPPPTPSPEVLAYAQGLARLLPQASAAPRRVSLIASLLSGGAPLATARGASAVQRLYETDQHLITLWDEADSAGTRYLIGQVYDKAQGPLIPQTVTLLPTHGEPREAQKEGSEFHAPRMATGTYLLRCVLESIDLYVPGVEVGH